MKREHRLAVLALVASLVVAPALSYGGKKLKLVEDSTWGFSFQAPKFKAQDHPMAGQPKFVLAGSVPGRCSLNLSVFVEVVPWGSSASLCRGQYTGNPAKVSASQANALIRQEEEPVTFTLFDMRVAGFTQNQLYAYWTRNDLCFEVHVSAVECEGFAAAALPIVQSVQLSGDTGATPETVALSRSQGGKPGDWEVHMVAAGLYLHNEQVRNPARARRFYRSALERGGDGMDEPMRWLALSGTGISWLMEDVGEEAIPALEAALAVVESSSNTGLRGEAYSETHFNLACAYSIVGELEAGCAALRSYLDTGPAEMRAGKREKVEQDPQLASLRNSECYQALGSAVK